MKLLKKKGHYIKFTCNFCKREIQASKKTEIFYRSAWINGCNDCFALSITPETSKDFQSKNY
ncbi:MAG: hypothetical protein WAV30_05345 [Microgenomates group bacterium]